MLGGAKRKCKNVVGFFNYTSARGSWALNLAETSLNAEQTAPMRGRHAEGTQVRQSTAVAVLGGATRHCMGGRMCSHVVTMA